MSNLFKLSKKAKAIVVSSVGGGLEMFDFSIYIFFAPIIAALFFPSQNELASLLKTFSVFAVGYLSRPLGAIFFGHYGDKLGRKKMMLFSIVLMAFATTAIGLLPTYHAIGILAPLMLVLLRALQGFAVGGDMPGAITFVAEYAAENRRGFSCSFLYFSVNIGLLLASLIGTMLTVYLSHDQLTAWGWRIAFLLGIVIGFVGFYLRSKVSETPYFETLEQSHDVLQFPFIHLFRRHLKEILQSIGLSWLFAVIVAQLFLFMPTYLYTTSKVSMGTALALNSFSLIIFSLTIPLAGYLSDQFGRKPIILIVSILFFVLSYPLYSLLSHPSLWAEMIGLGIFSLLAAGIVGVVPATLAELFGTAVRYSGVAISYNIAFALGAGLTPVFATYLLYRLQTPEAPSLNLMVAAIVAFFAMLLPYRNQFRNKKIKNNE